MRRVGMFLVALVVAVGLPGPPVAALQDPAPAPDAATCDEARIDTDSYRLTTEAQAMNVLRPREPWWEPYGVWAGPLEIGDLNQGAARLAERAGELDDDNLLAHGYLARQHIVMAVDADKAAAAWERVLDSGGAITWTATLYDVDPRSFFVLAFDRTGIRVFTFGALAGELRTRFGVPEFPRPERVNFWRALGGCLPPAASPVAEVLWTSVREIHPTRWTLRFELQEKVEITSDRGKRHADDTLEVNLHGQTGLFDFRFGMTPFGRRPFHTPPIGLDPAAYQARVKQFLETFFRQPGSTRISRRNRPSRHESP
jgi:hypothetical protein